MVTWHHRALCASPGVAQYPRLTNKQESFISFTLHMDHISCKENLYIKTMTISILSHSVSIFPQISSFVSVYLNTVKLVL